VGAAVTDTCPHEVGEKVWTAEATEPDSQKTADAVNAFVRRSHEILADHPVNKQRIAEGLLPANIALPRGIGIAPAVGSLDETWHIRSACIVETGLIRGIGFYLKMNVIDVPGANGALDSDVMATARAVVAALEDHNLILCNIKGPDVAGHDDQPQAKAEMIERVDGAVGEILAGIGPDTYVFCTGDHSTPCEVGDHSGDPVPAALWGPSLVSDGNAAFSERDVLGGGLGRIRGTDVMPILTNLMGVQHKFGA